MGGPPRAFDTARLAADPGWIAAAPTPVLRQRGPQDCGPTALAMVAGRWRVAPPARPGAAGLPAVRLDALRDAARAMGLEAYAIAGDRATLLHELRAGRPVILGLLVPAGLGRARRHYEVVVAAHPGRDEFVTLDPASGWGVRGWAELDAQWQPVGRPALVVLGLAPPAPTSPARPPP